jgi:hypothetical protein
MFISSVAKQKYVLDEHPIRVRGTPEYNPLYDAFQSDTVIPQRQTRNDFRPITPPQPRFILNAHDVIESPYDKPRSYRVDNEKKQRTNGQKQRTSRSQKKVGEISAQK